VVPFGSMRCEPRKGWRRVGARGVPASQALSRTRLRATAARLCGSWVLARPAWR